ncbi:MAG: DNA repair protein RecN [Elusimicrobia bacterium GWA2_69_24]|nr:MAG: DNA repair protein RecN [Elusimicrobia bacterium GWA2_69_24]
MGEALKAPANPPALLKLHIRNFAVIDAVELEFPGGLTVLTGETGAGKSMLIEALGFLLGGRGSAAWIRSGAAKLEVRGEFSAAGLSRADRAELGLSGERFTARRELDAGGKSRAFLDGAPTTAALLARLGDRIVDFHGQHEHQSLLRPSVQLELLDSFGGLGARRTAAGAAFARWREAGARIEALRMSTDERLRRIDLYGFQVQEISEVEPRPGEEEELAAELPRIKNAEKLRSLLEAAYGELYEREGSAEESLRRAERAVAAMAQHDPALSASLARLSAAREAVEETASELSRYRDGLGMDPERVDELLGRQDRIARLKKKYGDSVAEILDYRDRIRAELDALERHEERAEELARERQAAEEALRGLCEELHGSRMRAAQSLSKKAMAQLRDLGMASASLSVSVEMEEGQYGSSGADRVEFLIAANPGEPARPLREIASGGELSRVMLALKTVLAGQDSVGLLVFDEVDAGVGAAVGRAVGAKLGEVGRARQVFCVTHLPQVACFAANHFHVSKGVAGGRTSVRVERLEGKRRLETIAAMLGGRQVTETSLRHAKELLESA